MVEIITFALSPFITSPVDTTMLAMIYAAEPLTNKDRLGLRYIEAYHQRKLT
jgi:hypothetical protein